MTHAKLSIQEVLKISKTIAVVGMSANSQRASHGVARYLQAQGYRIVPVNPSCAGTSILGEQCYATLSEAAAVLRKEHVGIDIVDCFRKSETIEPIAEEAIAIGARCLWMQLGVINQVAAAKAEKAGLTVVMDRCIKIDHMHAYCPLFPSHSTKDE